MGLGKTLQTYGLILSNPAPNNERTPYVTLIVSPVSVMANWTQQADQHIKEDALSVGIYQGKISVLLRFACRYVHVLSQYLVFHQVQRDTP